MKKLLLVAMMVGSAYAQQTLNCGLVADMAAALHAGNNQQFRNLSLGATGLELQAAQLAAQKAPANLGPAEVRESTMRACLKTVR